jgi:hypothetical protein
MSRPRTDIDRAVVKPGTGRHQGPETGAVLATLGGIQVRKARVVPKLVGEDTYAAGLLTFTGVDGLEVINVTIRFVEVTVAVPVIAVSDVELA